MSKITPLLTLLILLYFIFFLHLGRQPIRLWDESRLAHNAYEMSKNGDYIVTHFEGKADMWNLKPPLMIWCQVIFIKLLGPTEMSIRLPAAICGLLTSLLLLYFCWKHLNKFWMGFFAALILSATNGFIYEHGMRHGEYEGMHIFFMTFYALYFYLYFENKNNKYLYLASAALIFAVLTKGIAGLFLMPVVVAAAFLFPGTRQIFTSRHFYISILLFVFFVPGYYLLRENMNPGYIKEVIQNEALGRYASPIEEHKASFWMYWEFMKNRDLTYWWALMLCGIVAGLLSIENRMKKISIYSISCFIFLFLLVSSAESKLFWYIYPSYPFLALLAAYFIWIIFNILSDLDVKKFMKYNALPFLFIFIVFIYPYDNMLSRIYLAPEKEAELKYYGIGYYLQRLIKGNEKLSEPLKVYYTEYNAHISYYINILNEKNIPVEIARIDQIKTNDLVACSLPEDKKSLNEKFNVDSVGSNKNFVIYRIE